MITLLSALLISANAAAAPPDHPPEVREFLDIVTPPLMLKVPGAEKVKIKRDVPYKSVDGTPLLADIYSPPTRSGAPVVVLIHGGMGRDFPVRPKEWGMYQSWGRTLAASGFVTIAFNHRLGFPEPRLREASSDLRDLIGHIRNHAAELNADPERIALVAFSAGGPLLAPAMQTRPPYIRCLVSYYNFLDISRTIHHSQFESPETIREFSPVTHLAPDNPPMLVVRAGRDAIPALNESIATFVARAVEVNAPLTLMIHPTAPHGFENKQDDARTREILSSTVEFLKRHLDAPK